MRRKKPLLPIQKEFSSYRGALGAIDKFNGQGMLIEFVGESGSGKTTIAKNYMEKHDLTHYIVCSSTMGIKDLMQKIAEGLGIHLSGNTYHFQSQLTDGLKDNAEHTFILDECEYLSKNNVDKLEVLRQIWDATNNTFIFCGTYKLRKILIGSSSDPKSEYSQLYRRMKKIKIDAIPQEEFYGYLDLIEKYYAVRFGKEARNSLYSYCADTKHGGLGIAIDILKMALDTKRPEWVSISVHLAHAEETSQYFPDDFRLRDPEESLVCYDPNAVQISEEEIAKLEVADITASLIRSASKYIVVV